MMLDGIRMRRSRVYGFRHGDPTTDVDSDGEPVDTNYVVIVRIKDCKLERDPKTGRVYYNPQGVPQAMALGYGGTYYGYGAPQVVKSRGRYMWVHEDDGSEHWTWVGEYVKTPVYMVRDARVYVGATYRPYNESAKQYVARMRGKAA